MPVGCTYAEARSRAQNGPCRGGDPRVRRRRKAGFSLLVVVLITGVLTLTALMVFTSLADEARLQGLERRVTRARAVAEGGLSEMINDQRVFARLPSSFGQTQEVRDLALEASAFAGVRHRSDAYRGQITLVRVGPVLESSQRRVRALFYEVRVEGTLPSGETAGVEALVYRLGVAPNSLGGDQVYGQ